MSPKIVRFDRVDVFLFLWLATYAVLSEGADRLPIFPAGHALLVLVMILLARRAFVPEAHRMIQFVNATLLSLASGSAVAMVPWQNQFVKYGATVFFFMMACVWAREFIAGAFGINAATAVEIKGLRSLLPA